MPLLYVWPDRSVYIADHVLSVSQRHYHLKLLVALDGEIRITTPVEDLRGASVLVAPDHPHRCQADGRVLCLLVDPRLGLARRIRHHWLARRTTAILPPRVLAPYVRAMTHWSAELIAKSAATKLVRAILEALAGSRTPPPPPVDPRIEDTFRYLRTCLDRRVTIAELAERVRLSPVRFAHLFRDQAGVSLRRFLLWARIRRANHHVFDGMSLTEAAHAAGFADSAHFCRTYRRLLGISPSQALRSRAVRIVVCEDER